MVFLDLMNSEYDALSCYKRGLGGTQSAYLFFATYLSDFYNIIIINKSGKNELFYQNNLYFWHYENIEPCYGIMF